MGLRFQKRIRIFKGLTLNLSKTGTSWTVGRPGLSFNIKGDKITSNIGIPGTGLSYRTRIDQHANSAEGSLLPPPDTHSQARTVFNRVLWLVAGLLLLMFMWHAATQ
jgi:Protein of unknown function (DUF4236)